MDHLVGFADYEDFLPRYSDAYSSTGASLFSAVALDLERVIAHQGHALVPRLTTHGGQDR